MIKYNIELFKIDKPSEKYMHFLPFLVRKFYGKKFNGTFRRLDFINIGVKKFGYKKKTIEQIFDKGIKDNSFVLKSYIKRNIKHYVLAGNNDKKVNNITVSINNYILKKIHFMSDFYTFCFLIIASRPFATPEKIDNLELNKLRGRTLKTIGKDFGGLSKIATSYHITKGKELFNGYFNTTSRYGNYNGYITRLSNIYSFDGIEYRYIKNIESPKSSNYIYKSNYKGNNFNFGEAIKGKKEFLPAEEYIHYKKIIETVISKY